jgi:hypothetical protein
MFKQLENKIKDMLIIDENEPILSHIQVIDYIKQQQILKKNKEDIVHLLTPKRYSIIITSKKLKNI